MFRSALFAKLSNALALSAAAVAAAVLVQAALLRWQDVAQALGPSQIAIRQFSLGADDQKGLTLLTVYPRLCGARPQSVVGIYDLGSQPLHIQRLNMDDSPWQIASASGSRYGFLCTENGELYCLDLATPQAPKYLGRHEAGYVRLMKCMGDGSTLIVASRQLSAWDRGAARLLWRRSDMSVTGCAFVPGSHHLICGLESGDLVELDGITGISLRLIAQRPEYHEFIVRVAVSQDGTRVATMDRLGNCIVRELAIGQPVWSHRCWLTGGVQFSPDGQMLLLPNFQKDVDIAMVSLPSGAVVAQLCDVEGLIQDVTVNKAGTAYLWNNFGTITAWNLATGLVTARLRPLADGPPTSSTSQRWLEATGVLGKSW